MTHDDFQVEPVHGLPEDLPHGEQILWQGAPQVWPLAKAAMNVHWVIGWFALIAVWRGIIVGDAQGVGAGIFAASFYLLLGAVAALLIIGGAWMMARNTVYTITTHRIAMRIGAALTVTLNLPFRWIASADLQVGKNGVGSIFLDLKGETRLSYLVCWPHVKPWVMANPRPALRAIPDARAVAVILGQAAEARVGEITCEMPEAELTPVAAE